ncbi:MAG: CehA/McbA family metallohydrolase, partial [Bradymonadaceae bacterium]
VGSGSLASVVDPAYESIGVQTGRITGRVVDTGGRPVPNARVTAVGLEDGRGFNQAVTDADGRYSMRTPDGTWRVSARTPARSPVRTVRAEVEPGTTTRTTVTTNRPARLTVAATTPEGRKVPARVSIACVNGCPNPATAAERDVGGESLPGGFEAIEPTALDGRLRRRLPPGTYRVSVSRGPEWSVWPGDAPATRGRRVQLSPGESVSLEAEIARVVDTPGALASDFHVHGVRSADSNVGRADRVMQFVSDGVEVIVGTDHDVVTDYRPVISDLGAEQWIEGIPGDEITTSDTGHFNGFPIPQDPSHRAGGALDWGRGPRPNMPPPAIYDWIQSFPGEQVVQMNHPVTPAIGTITGLEADVLRGTSHADPDRFRLPPPTGDNGRGWWSDDFTAIELMNGARVGRFWATARWWLTMIGRGFSPTGTAVTDTHTLYGDLGGVPRTYVQVPESSDEPDELDTSAFVASVNDGRAIGTNGPFVRWSLHESGRRAGLSGTLRIRDGDVSAEVRIETPTWMRVERVDFFSNVPGVVTEPGEVVETPLDPTASISLDRSASNLETTARGDRPHRRVVHEVRTELDVTADAYVVAVVRGRGEMRPVVTTRGASPFAFTNPIFVDANGGGYDDPPLEDRAAHEGASSSRSTDSLHGEPPNRAHGHVGRRRPPTREAIERLLRRPPD